MLNINLINNHNLYLSFHDLTNQLSESELPPLLDDWALIELPNSEAELIQQAKTPEQV